MKFYHLASAIMLSLAVCTTQAFASNSQRNLFPDHDYSQFTLPTVGESRLEVVERYGEPSARQQGSNGVAVWDYGSFRVIFRDDAVSYSAMW